MQLDGRFQEWKKQRGRFQVVDVQGMVVITSWHGRIFEAHRYTNRANTFREFEGLREHDFAIDGNGYPHLAYGNDHLTDRDFTQ